MSGAAPPPAEILQAFLGGTDVHGAWIATGHIHRSWGGARTDTPSLLLQELNTSVFRDPHAVVANAVLVTDALRRGGVPTLTLVESSTGALLEADHRGALWRALVWIDGRTADATHTGDIARAAEAFGRFASVLADVSTAGVRDTIDRFHDLDRRVADLLAVIDTDPAGRVAGVRGDVDRCRHVLARLVVVPEVGMWRRAPVWVVHNDAKPANALVCPDGSVCVIDLDTTMAGTVLADVGELLRSSTGPATDDDGRAATLHIERFALVVRSWLAGWQRPLVDAERAALAASGLVCTLENAVRFLTDHLAGDRYFRVLAPGDNLHRFRSQLAHAQVQLDGLDDLRRVVDRELEASW